MRSPWTGILFLAPSIILLACLTLLPIAFLLGISVFDYQLGMPLSSAKFVGPQHYRDMFSTRDPSFWPSVRVTVFLAVGTTILNMVMGMAVAVLLDKIIRGRTVFTIIMLIPMVIAPSVVGIIWGLMYNDSYGLINAILSRINAAPNWLGSAALAPWAVIIVEVWEWTPFVALILLAGLQGIPQDPVEAAQVDGAGPGKIFWSIVLPLLRPLILLVVLLRLIDMLKLFDMVYVLTGGGPGSATETLGLRVFNLSLHTQTDVGRASAFATVLIALILLLSLLVIRSLQRAETQTR